MTTISDLYAKCQKAAVQVSHISVTQQTMIKCFVKDIVEIPCNNRLRHHK